MSWKGIAFRALVRPDEVEMKTESGIVLAVDEKLEKNAQTTGTIVVLGEDFAAAFKPKTPFWGLKVGDKIHYPKYAGKWVRHSKTKEELLAINDEDVIVAEAD